MKCFRFVPQVCVVALVIFCLGLFSTIGITMPIPSQLPPVKVVKTENSYLMDNGIIQVDYTVASNTFTISYLNQPFLKEASMGEFSGPQPVKVLSQKDSVGIGKAIQMQVNGDYLLTLSLYRGIPFLLSQVSVQNPSDKPLTITNLTAFQGKYYSDQDLGAIRHFGCEGVQDLSKNRSSYFFSAIVNPSNRAGVVCGYLTSDSGSGIVFTDRGDGFAQVHAQTQYGKVQVPSHKSKEGEIFAIGYFEDCLDGLETYATICAQQNKIKLPPVLSGYCTWYHARALDEKRMAELAAFSKKNLEDYGFNFLQIDDQWQVSTKTERRDFTTYKPDGPYPSGMKATAETIHDAGLRAGLWLIPFAWDPQAPALKDHPDWFMKTKDGEINKVYWAGYCLDLTNPDTIKFVKETIHRICKDWDYDYLKLDGLWSGIGCKTLYPNPAYREDNLGEAVWQNPAMSQIEAYRAGLQAVRDAAGKKTFLLGCNIAQNMRTMGASIGRVDGMRVGRDIGAKWEKIIPCAELASTLYFWNTRVWYNDPDCLMLRDPLTLDQARAWASLIAISGQLNVVSEWLPGLPPEKLDILKRTLPNHGLCGRPIDLFDSAIPRLWHLTVGEDENQREIIGVFNWDDKNPATIQVDLTKMNLPKQSPFVGFDYWENKVIAPFSGSLTLHLKPSSCHILVLQPKMDHPQLISTSRHITQGGVDVTNLKWNADRKTLTGVSAVVGGDPYELRIAVPETNWKVKSVSVGHKKDVTIEPNPEDAARYLIKSPVTQSVKWTLKFE